MPGISDIPGILPEPSDSHISKMEIPLSSMVVFLTVSCRAPLDYNAEGLTDGIRILLTGENKKNRGRER